MSTIDSDTIFHGLAGVNVAETRMSKIDGTAGKLWIRGYPLESFAGKKSNEEVLHLLFTGRFPNDEELKALKEKIYHNRKIPAITMELMRQAANARVSPMDALRMGISSLSLEFPNSTNLTLEENYDLGLALIAKAPTMLAAFWRYMDGEDPIEPSAELGNAANFLYMLEGRVPSEKRSKALEVYMNTVSEHGFNASTFAARAILSTNSDFISAITGAIGSLKGDKHGGAPGPALEMMKEIGTVDRIESYMRPKFENKEIIMGFGHRVYKVRDPRSVVLSEAARKLYEGENEEFYNLVMEMVDKIEKLFDEYKPGRNIRANVEIYTALILHGVGLKPEIFSSIFAISRMAGWVAHLLEQYENNRLIRPRAVYVGELHDGLND